MWTLTPCLSSSQLRYAIKFLAIYNLWSDNYLTIWEFECLELQHYIMSILKSRILKIIFQDLSFIRLSETYLISILEKAYLDGAWQKSLASRFSIFLFLCTCFYYCNFIVGVLFFSMGWNWKVIMVDSSFNLSNLIDSTEWIISWIYTTIFDMLFFVT